MRSPVQMWLLAGALALAGCHPDTARVEARERESPSFRRALACEQSGDLDGAIRFYQESLLDHPRLFSAHLHLALLLQDHRKDYIAAIYHYRRYEALRPETEKGVLISDRARMAEQLLAMQLLGRDDVAVNREQQRLAVELARLNQRLSVVEGEKATLQEQANALGRQLAEQRAESDRLRRLSDRLQLPGGESGAARERSALPRLDAETSRLTATPPPTAPTAAFAPDIETLTVPRVSPPPSPVSAATATPPTAATTPPATPPAAASPDPAARTYVAQPGDSLFRIAERFYGDALQWKRIRDANKDAIDPDGRLRPGQTLTIP